ncbi:enoyl reductase [Trichodelitschia bisporula]|uniref:very-long-chain enoyl-CoA reductase n=1 Tax=Trichodelitschia bisporula TaxID=703511 RepID=A0A6G1I687_9PEZI|nr:enoyl reductase [Trichodelitschia bisporula]
MAETPISLSVKSRGKLIKFLPTDYAVTPSSPSSDLYAAFASKTRLSPHRLRIVNDATGQAVPNVRDISLATAGLHDGSTVSVKDLGPQIAWRTVFIVEYLGPLLLHPLIFELRPYLYSSPSSWGSAVPAPSNLQTLSLVLITLHFIKRELETIFVHRFSLATMPALNIFKNSAHYWLLAGANIAYWTYSPRAAAQAHNPPISPTDLLLGAGNDPLTALGVILFAAGELLNLNSHLVLRDLRRPGSTERGIPRGFGYNWVTCPNYLFEIVAWVGIALVTRSWSTWVFVVIAGGQMVLWAQKKERRYRKEFGDKYKKKRFAMVPGLI